MLSLAALVQHTRERARLLFARDRQRARLVPSSPVREARPRRSMCDGEAVVEIRFGGIAVGRIVMKPQRGTHALKLPGEGETAAWAGVGARYAIERRR
jgi:hypothetical protein